jgi:hypothetical protein
MAMVCVVGPTLTSLGVASQLQLEWRPMTMHDVSGARENPMNDLIIDHQSKILLKSLGVIN